MLGAWKLKSHVGSTKCRLYHRDTKENWDHRGILNFLMQQCSRETETLRIIVSKEETHCPMTIFECIFRKTIHYLSQNSKRLTFPCKCATKLNVLEQVVI
jgi:hypothetical protein